jgi:hypothetical protein
MGVVMMVGMTRAEPNQVAEVMYIQWWFRRGEKKKEGEWLELCYTYRTPH